jgi:hypothetical protein
VPVRRALLATCAELPGGDEDADALVAALARTGVSAQWCVWDDPAVDWSDGLVVLRSTWDYTARRPRFLDWVGTVPRVLNAPDVVVWNSDKTYLAELADAGVPVVHTQWARPGLPVTLPASGHWVVKPSVGAGSLGAGRFDLAADAAQRDAADHIAQLHAAGRTAMLQPYLDGVDQTGEAALIYLDGVFSHAVTKAAMLPAGAVNPLVSGYSRDAPLYVEERMSSRVASAAERRVGDQLVGYLRRRFGAPPLYTRVDLLPAGDGPVLLELELVEPSLFLGYADGAADRFAAAISSRC